MGKKKILKQTTEDILKETEAQEKNEMKFKSALKGRIGKYNQARVCIQSTYNNTIVTITDNKGNVLGWNSAGASGFKGPRKATPFAASKVVDLLLEKNNNLNIKEVSVLIKGVGTGRDAAIRALVNHGLEINSIKDITPIPHNGCRPPKPRRV